MSDYRYSRRSTDTMTAPGPGAGPRREGAGAAPAGGFAQDTFDPDQAVQAVQRGRVGTDEVIFFANQLAVMVDTGVPVTEAIDTIAEQAEHPGLRSVLTDVGDRVKAGMEFSAALERHPRVFSELFVSLVRASEASGTLGSMLQRVATYLGEQRETRKRVQGAMVYPLCMLGFCVAVVVGLLAFVLPRFEKIYANKQAALPALTRGLLAMSDGIVTYWPLLVAGVVAAGVGIWAFARSERGKLTFDRLRIDLPETGGG